MKIKNLYVGDPHATVESLPDVKAVMDFAVEKATEGGADNLVVLGDLFHTHAIINVVTLNFWLEWFKKESETLKHNLGIKVLVGNHDIPGKTKPSEQNSLKALVNYVRVIEGKCVEDGIEYRPYYHSVEEFQKEPVDAKVLVCHAQFLGTQYENGFYAPPEDCVDSEQLSAHSIISGHIHKSAQIGKVLYTGSSRWVTIADANQQKYLWLIEHDTETGESLVLNQYGLSQIATPIRVFDLHEGGDLALPECPKGRTIVNLHGSQEWVSEQAQKLKGVEVRRFPKFNKLGKVSEAKGIAAAFNDFAQAFKPPYPEVDKQDTLTKVKGVIGE